MPKSLSILSNNLSNLSINSISQLAASLAIDRTGKKLINNIENITEEVIDILLFLLKI
jgi:hypothetical protein